MMLKELKVGMKVRDRYWPAIIGKVVKVSKTRCHIMFYDGIQVYSKANIRFLIEYCADDAQGHGVKSNIKPNGNNGRKNLNKRKPRA